MLNRESGPPPKREFKQLSMVFFEFYSLWTMSWSFRRQSSFLHTCEPWDLLPFLFVLTRSVENAFQYHHGTECLAGLCGQFRMSVLKSALFLTWMQLVLFFLLGDLKIPGVSHFQAAFRIFVSNILDLGLYCEKYNRIKRQIKSTHG